MKGYKFVSVFSEELTEYIQIRRCQGYTDNPDHVLQKLDQYLVSAGVKEKALTYDIVDGFIAANRIRVRGSTISTYVTMCSGFGKYLNHIGIPAFVAEHFPRPSDYIPYIFSEEEITTIFAITDNLQADSNCTATVQIPMLLRMLYGCGLRLGEALSLRLSNIDFERGVIYVLNAKGKKDRLVPMDKSLAIILEQYCKYILPCMDKEQPIFPGKAPNGTHGNAWARYWFVRILKEAGIVLEPHQRLSSRGVCLHCFRHTFAVNSYRNQYYSGVDNYRTAPIISVYLGHECLTYTERYLNYCEANAQDILSITAQYAGIFPEVPDEE